MKTKMALHGKAVKSQNAVLMKVSLNSLTAFAVRTVEQITTPRLR